MGFDDGVSGRQPLSKILSYKLAEGCCVDRPVLRRRLEEEGVNRSKLGTLDLSVVSLVLRGAETSRRANLPACLWVHVDRQE